LLAANVAIFTTFYTACKNIRRFSIFDKLTYVTYKLPSIKLTEIFGLNTIPSSRTFYSIVKH